MTTIRLKTRINSSIEKTFDISRSIDFHMESASHTHERAISGRTSGLIEFGETVTWQGRHFGLLLRHTSKIIEFRHPFSFTDVMIEGHFNYFAHQHIFSSENGKTIMLDILKYKTPYGILGSLFDTLFLKRHLTQFLLHRNEAIKKQLETSPEHVATTFGTSLKTL